ncbi:HD domain-containing protein [Aerococcaceae bacterium DSM 111176]|nr:HD domain-containing protein [Aerococcaceae bacterium DSM 111176]
MNINKIHETVKEQFVNETTGHDWDHINRVVANSRLILQEYGDVSINHDIVIAAAYVHDLIDDKLFDNLAEAEKKTRTILKEADANLEEIDIIIEICHKQSYSANIENVQKLTKEGQIVQDADRLDAIGAIGILRTAYYGGAKGHKLYSEDIDQSPDLNDKASYRQSKNVIQHFYDKLLNIENLMNTEVAQKIARQRSTYMREFLAQLNEELTGNR